MKSVKVVVVFAVFLSVNCLAVPVQAAPLPNPVEIFEKLFSKPQREKTAAPKYQAKLAPASIADPLYQKKKAYYKEYLREHRFKSARHRVFYQNGF